MEEDKLDDYQKAKMLVMKKVPSADPEDVEDMLDEILEKQPDMTLEEFAKSFTVLLPIVTKQIAQEAAEPGSSKAKLEQMAKTDALASMKGGI